MLLIFGFVAYVGSGVQSVENVWKIEFSILISMDIPCNVHAKCGKRRECNMEINK